MISIVHDGGDVHHDCDNRTSFAAQHEQCTSTSSTAATASLSVLIPSASTRSWMFPARSRSTSLLALSRRLSAEDLGIFPAWHQRAMRLRLSRIVSGMPYGKAEASWHLILRGPRSCDYFTPGRKGVCAGLPTPKKRTLGPTPSIFLRVGAPRKRHNGSLATPKIFI